MAGVRTELFHVSSEFGVARKATNPTNNYKFVFPHKLRNVRRVGVHGLEWGNGVYNVDATNFITLQFVTYPQLPAFTNPQFSGERKLSIPAGSYDLTLLVDALNTQLAIYPDTATVVTADLNNAGAVRFEVATSAQKGVRIVESSAIFGGISRQSQSDLLDANTTQTWLDLGLAVSPTYVTYVEAVKPVNLVTQKVVFLRIDELDRVHRHMYGHEGSGVNRSGIITRFQTLNVEYGDTVFVKADDTQTYAVDVRGEQCLDLSSITVTWINELGEELDLHHVPNSFLLKISYDY